MPRRMSNFSAYWSDEHAKLLYYCAKKVISAHPNRNLFEIDDLVNTAWLRILRRRKSDKLKGYTNCVLQTMYTELYYVLSGHTKYKHKKYGTPRFCPIENVCIIDNSQNTNNVEVRDELDCLLAGFSVKEREFLLRRVEGDTHCSPSGKQKVSSTACYNHYKNLLRQIQQRIKVKTNT